MCHKGLLVIAPPNIEAAFEFNTAAAPAATAQLLADMGKLSQLRHLDHSNSAIWERVGFADQPPQLLTALVASSQLQHLRLQTQQGQLLPRGAIAHWVAGRQLAQLTTLVLADVHRFAEIGGTFDDANSWSMVPDDLSRICSVPLPAAAGCVWRGAASRPQQQHVTPAAAAAQLHTPYTSREGVW